MSGEITSDRESLRPELDALSEPGRDLRAFEVLKRVHALASPEGATGRAVRAIMGDRSNQGDLDYLQNYRKHRLSRGEKPFAYLEDALQRQENRDFREQLPMFRTMFSGTDKFAEAFPAEQRLAIGQTFATSMNPDADVRATANKLFFMAMTGVEVDPERWPLMRTRYAEQAFGWRGGSGIPGGEDPAAAGAAPAIISDDAFYQFADRTLEQQKKEQDKSERIYRDSMRAAFKALPLQEGIASARKVAGEDWKRYEPAARQGYASILADFSDDEIRHGRRLFEEFAKIEGFDTATIGGGKEELIAALAAYGRADQAGRDKRMNLVGLNAEAEAQDVENYFARIGGASWGALGSFVQLYASGQLAGEARSIDDLIKGGLMPADSPVDQDPNVSAAELARKIYFIKDAYKENKRVIGPTRPMSGKEREKFQLQADAIRGTAAFLADSKTAGIRVRKLIDDKREGFWDTWGDRGVIGAESLTTMAWSALPYGAGLPVLIQSYQARTASNYRRAGMAAAQADSLALPSAILEAGIDRLQIVSLGAKLPGMQAWLLKWGKPGAIANFGLRWTGVGVLESGQEVAQDFTAPAVQEFAVALKMDIPGVAWDEVIAREKAALGDIVGVSFGFALIFGGGGAIVDHMEASRVGAMLKDRDAIELLGIAPERARAIAERAASAPASAAEMLKQAGMETSIQERQANAAVARERLKEGAPEAAAGTPDATLPDMAAAGLPVVEALEDGRMRIAYPDRAAEVVQDRQAAAEALDAWDADAVVEITRANREMAAKLGSPGDVNPARGAADSLTDGYVSFTDWTGGVRQRLDQAFARTRILARSEGIDLPADEVGRDSSGKVDSRESYGAEVTRMAMEINQARQEDERSGTTVMGPLEEHAGNVAKRLMDRGHKTPQWMVKEIRATEAATGRSLLHPDLGSLGEARQRQELVKSFARLAIDDAMGKVQESQLAPGLRVPFRSIKETVHAGLELAAEIKSLRESGRMDTDIARWLDREADHGKAHPGPISLAEGELTPAREAKPKVSREQLRSLFVSESGLEGDKLEQAVTETEASSLPDEGGTSTKSGVLSKFLDEFSGFMKRVAEGGPDAPKPGGKAASILLADRLTHQIESWKPLGSIVKGPEDIFALNEAFRNPWFKSIRLMAVNPETGEVVGARVHSMGTTSRLSSDLNDIMGFMEEMRGEHPNAELVISTNHPGGDPQPTEQDNDLHGKIQTLANEIGIPVSDYVITNGTRGWSMRTNEEFTMPDAMNVKWTTAERSEMPVLEDPELVRDLATALRASNPNMNWAVYLDDQYRARGMNLLPDDPQEAAKVILRDTWQQASENIILFPGEANKSDSQWAQPVKELLGSHRTRHAATTSSGNSTQAVGGHLNEGEGRPHLISFSSSITGPTNETSEKIIRGIDLDGISSYLESRGHEGGQLEQASRETEHLLRIQESEGSLDRGDRVSDGGRSPRGGSLSDAGLFFLTSSEQAISGGTPSSFDAALEPGGKPIGILLEEMIDRDLPVWEPLGKTVGSAEDIFALNAVFRNPWFESVRLMAVSLATGEVIAASIHSVGNIFSTAAEVSDMAGFVLAAREIDPQASLVVSHNHPGGDPTPSEIDEKLQIDLQNLANDLGITIMDHVITNGTRGYSMKDDMEFRMDPEMDVPWSSIERMDMPQVKGNHDLRNFGVALRAANESANWVVYLDKRRRIRAMNLLPDDPKAAAKVILRDTSAHGTPNVVLFPNQANEDSDKWATPINTVLGHEPSRPLDSFPIDPYEPSAREAGELHEGESGYNVISVPKLR